MVQFCDRFYDDNESNSDQSNDDDISAYDPQKSWEISDYIVCIDGVGVSTNKAISNLPKQFYCYRHVYDDTKSPKCNKSTI